MSSVPSPGSPDDPLVAYQESLRRGHAALLAGNPGLALVEYEAAAALAGERSLPHLSVGRALLALDRPADALAAFDRAHQRAPTDTGALQGKAEALTRLGRASEAAELADQIQAPAGAGRGAAGAARSLAQDEAQLNTGTLGRAEMLMVAAERAWQDRRTDTAVGQWLAAARFHAGEGHLDAALDACQRALLADAGDLRVHLELSRLYLARGWAEMAAERMDLLARALELEGPAELREELRALASTHAARDARLAALAARLGELPPA